MYKTPILFILFNRPEPTKQVFNEIRKVKPKYLYVAGDGPRPHKPDDSKNCSEARSVVDLIDWDCEVKTLFQPNNLGCGVACSTAINWFFEQVEEGIILEDDCLPASGFFTFCESMLERYRDNEDVFHISGNNFQMGRNRGEGSYYFSKYTGTWGWATWKRAWNHYQFNMENFENFVNQGKLEKVVQSKGEKEYWMRMFKLTEMMRIDTWDYQWTFTVWDQEALAIFPNTNLVKNIGFMENATHTFDPESLLANIELGEMDANIPPVKIIRDKKADDFFYRKVLEVEYKKNHPKKSFSKRATRAIARRLKRIVNMI